MHSDLVRFLRIYADDIEAAKALIHLLRMRVYMARFDMGLADVPVERHDDGVSLLDRIEAHLTPATN